MRFGDYYPAEKWQCRCGKCDVSAIAPHPMLVYVVDAISDEFAKKDDYGSLNLNSAIRCIDHNRSVGGGQYSMHVTGEAADLSYVTKDGKLRPRKLFLLTLPYLGKFINGLGIYNWGLHIDVRKVPFRMWCKIGDTKLNLF